MPKRLSIGPFVRVVLGLVLDSFAGLFYSEDWAPSRRSIPTTIEPTPSIRRRSRSLPSR